MKYEKRNLEQQTLSMQEDLKDRQEQIQRLKEENEKIMVMQQETEQTIQKYKELAVQKECIQTEQIKQLGFEIQNLTDENGILKIELKKFEEASYEIEFLKEKCEKQQQEILSQKKALDQQKADSMQMEGLKAELQNAKKESQSQLKKFQKKYQEMQQELAKLNEERKVVQCNLETVKA